MGAKPSFPLVPISSDRVAIVTGANTGIGYEIAKWLSIMGATVIIACRTEQRAREAITRMNEEYTTLKASGELGDLPELPKLAVEFMNLDLSSLTSTEKFADDFKKLGRPLHILICNAGQVSKYAKTEDGHEMMMQVNYLSHFLLTAKLLPVMLKSGEDCRIINMSSEAHRFAPFDLDTMDYHGNPDDFPAFQYYGRSKLYQVMQTHCMTRRLDDTNVTVNSSHPGMVRTEISRGFTTGCIFKCFGGLVKCFGMLKTPKEGAVSVINGAVNPALTGVNGRYYVDCKDKSVSRDARNQRKEEALWKRTLELLDGHLAEDELRCLEGEVTRLT